MPKLPTGNSLTMKIALSQVIETGNVRRNYDEEEIKLLADSIYKYGLLNPISVKFLREDENGIKLYELVAGHRRIRAFKYLCKLGQDYTQITASICKGQKEILQLVENIQREDLNTLDKETALQALITAGLSQQEIAEELSKPISWVHDNLSGTQVRETLEAQGIDTTGISTKALSQLGSVPGEKLPQVAESMKAKGGTVKAATDALNNFRKENGIAAPKNKKTKEPDFEPEPITIAIENVIGEITDYKLRQLQKTSDTKTPYKAIITDAITKICNDLISLFEAYQHN